MEASKLLGGRSGAWPLGRSLIGQGLGNLVTPGIPPRRDLPREEFQPGTGTGSFDQFAHHIRFFTVATARGLDPTPQSPIIEPIILALHSRKQDFMRHSPIMSFAKLRLAPDKLGDWTKSPMANDLIGRKMV